MKLFPCIGSDSANLFLAIKSLHLRNFNPMDYQQTLDYMFSQLPMYQRQGAAAYKANLDNTLAICKLVGNPETVFPSVHIAGTNGKGSVAHMVASVVQEAGYRTGLYTSPHLRDFRERIRVNGEKIPESYVIDFVEQHQSGLKKIQPSFFEMTFAMCMRYFADEQVDIAIIETGMGGRLDSTNVVRSVCTAITNIGLDHTRFLGSTIPEIAAEKAGIIKPGVPVIVGAMHEDALAVIKNKALECNSLCSEASDQWNAVFAENQLNLKKGDIRYAVPDFPLRGNYQLLNVPLAAAIVGQLAESSWKITDAHLVKGLKNVVQNTKLAGRWQPLKHTEKPEIKILCDTGHNADGLAFVIKQLASETYNQLHFVLGMVNDKDVSAVLAMLPVDAHYYFARPDIPRGLNVEILKAGADVAGLKGEAYPGVAAALDAAVHAATQNDLVFVGGSTFVVAEVVDL